MASLKPAISLIKGKTKTNLSRFKFKSPFDKLRVTFCVTMSNKKWSQPAFKGQPNSYKIARNIFLIILAILIIATIKVAIKNEWIIFE